MPDRPVPAWVGRALRTIGSWGGAAPDAGTGLAPDGAGTGPVRPPSVPAPRSTPSHRVDLRALEGFDTLLPVVDCRLYEGGRAVPVEHLGKALREAERRGGFVWIGLHGPTAADVERLAGPFGLPPAAVADATEAHQRPKLQEYPGTTFAVVKPVRYVDSEEVVDVSEVAVFLGPTFVITVRHGESRIPSRVRAELDADPALGLRGPAVVLERIVELAVAEYGGVVDAIAVDVDEIEEQVFSGDTADHAQRIYKLKREVLEFKRAVAPFAGPVQRLAEASAPDERGEPGLQDAQEDLLRAAEAIEGYDTLLTDVLQAHLAQVGVQQNRVAVRQNEDMRKISAWAAIALVPTAIAGIYGMNFENMPELGTRYGYFVVLAVIVVVCVALYALFRRRGWL
ncbi:magnesium transporter [Kineococcus xinjiangensis]|uniref:Magnesium transporter n=1 Tax=Kineococcus xinjiangensis TaxID=512762 RepID=A0A2S6IDQ7_9ACTN|nr:magnesium and cobalt transport protein CorA [Kineococcus xinjiangensis]PPK92339.1 magnesium transporter [Kineococcus xinjiangensis]